MLNIEGIGKLIDKLIDRLPKGLAILISLIIIMIFLYGYITPISINMNTNALPYPLNILYKIGIPTVLLIAIVGLVILLFDELLKRKNEKEKSLAQIQQILKLFSGEIKRNNELRIELINGEGSFRRILSINLTPFSKDYALGVTNIGHLLPRTFIEMVEKYINKIDDLNAWKKNQIDRVVSRGQYHIGNTNKFYKLLRESEELFNEVAQEVNKQIEICKEKMK